ncbi:Frag1/DRAM/Sfk1 family [Phytophthora infestans]|uniref:Frag1/DRAM/Sfk1 family n=1 Tax=Phytophthora infestans TaxID=4787 RepID=A0A8S9UL99_PHYIN|nr:Frag1/DRAM/Sfk1 family [Phytophthora infestans]
MATVQPISLTERNPVERVTFRSEDLTWHRNLLHLADSDDESSIDSASDASFSSQSSEVSSLSAPSDEESDSEFDSLSSSSDQDQVDILTQYSSDDEAIRPPESTQPSFTLTGTVLDTFGDMARTDNLGYIAWLVPFTGILTILGTEFLACVNHFTCSENFPTLSYAATFRPEAFAFTGGMCLTAIFIFTSVVLFFWYLQLRMQRRSDEEESASKQFVTGYACLVAGVTAAISLFGLAVLDMSNYHDAHINFTIAFFMAGWGTMIAVQLARKKILHEDETAEKSFSTDSLLVILRRRSFWLSLRRWRSLDVFTAYTLGRLLLNTGLASTFLFGLFFLCANGVWPNPLGFTAVQEAFFEAVAIVCQLLFMGTLSCELARLARLVERSDYASLERDE